MKTTSKITFILVMSFFASSCSVNHPKFFPSVLQTDLQKEEVKGKVKSIQVASFEGANNQKENDFDMEGYHWANYNLLFDTQGNTIEYVLWSSELTLGEYLKDAPEEQQQLYISSKTNTQYDKDRRIIKQMEENLGLNYGSIVENKYKYNYNGSKDTLWVDMTGEDFEQKKTFVFKKDKLLLCKLIGLKKPETNSFCVISEYKYFKDSIIEISSHYTLKEMYLTYKEISKFDLSGLIIKKDCFYSKDGNLRFDYSHNYRYDKEMNLIEIKSTQENQTKKIEYNKKDKYGNWLIKKITTPTNVEIIHRKIQYY